MNNKLALICMLLIFAIYPYNAKAIEQPNYNEKISTTIKYQINLFLEELFETNISIYNIANIDLNGDGINEYILKRKSCDIKKTPEKNARKTQCIHNIIAEKNDELILLSQIKAKNIMIGNTSSYGIKDLLIFKNEINDYSFDIYMWSPYKKMYIINAE